MKNQSGELGKIYRDGEVIIRQGDVGRTMHVIQEGVVEIVLETPDAEIHLGEMKAGDFFGEMALFDRETRSATVRAKGTARVITIDKRNFLSRVHQDPSLAFRLVETLSLRVRKLERQLHHNQADVEVKAG